MGLLDLEKKVKELFNNVTPLRNTLLSLQLLQDDSTVYVGKKFVDGELVDDALTVAVELSGTTLTDYGLSIHTGYDVSSYLGTLELYDANDVQLYRKANTQIYRTGKWFAFSGVRYFNFTFKQKIGFDHYKGFEVFVDNKIDLSHYLNNQLRLLDNDGVITATNVDTDDVYTLYPQDGGGSSGITVINDAFSMADLLSACLNFDPGAYHYYTTVACTDKATWVTAGSLIIIYNPTGQYQDVRVEIVKQQAYGTAYMTSDTAWTYTSIR